MPRFTRALTTALKSAEGLFHLYSSSTSTMSCTTVCSEKKRKMIQDFDFQCKLSGMMSNRLTLPLNLRKKCENRNLIGKSFSESLQNLSDIDVSFNWQNEKYGVRIWPCIVFGGVVNSTLLPQLTPKIHPICNARDWIATRCQNVLNFACGTLLPLQQKSLDTPINNINFQAMKGCSSDSTASRIRLNLIACKILRMPIGRPILKNVWMALESVGKKLSLFWQFWNHSAAASDFLRKSARSGCNSDLQHIQNRFKWLFFWLVWLLNACSDDGKNIFPHQCVFERKILISEVTERFQTMKIFKKKHCQQIKKMCMPEGDNFYHILYHFDGKYAQSYAISVAITRLVN